VPADDQGRFACPGGPDGGPICFSDTQWIVEPVGPHQGVNAFGAPVQVPAVRFVSRAVDAEPTWPSDPTLTDVQKAILSAHQSMVGQASPGRASSCISTGPGGPCIAIPPPPREDDYDSRIAWRDAMDAWRGQREDLMQQVEEVWGNR
jgi:hypothetical protein